MRYFKKVCAFIVTLTLFCAMAARAYAHEIPDTSKTGSVSVSITYNGNAVPGGTLAFYRVGEIAANGGDYSFTLTGAFAKSKVSLDDISSSELAETLAEYASSKALSGKSVTVGSDGKAVAEELELGLYLVVQTEAATGYQAASPFLVSLPAYEDGAYIYDVDAAPKMSALATTTPAAVSTVTATPTTTTAASAKKDSLLPQTGQLNWPVPVLATLGLLLFASGWALRLGKYEMRDNNG